MDGFKKGVIIGHAAAAAVVCMQYLLAGTLLYVCMYVWELHLTEAAASGTVSLVKREGSETNGLVLPENDYDSIHPFIFMALLSDWRVYVL